MPGPHYALSEALLVVAALWAAVRLYRGGYILAAPGILLFGLAAAMGVWRFGSSAFDGGAIDEWATIHRTLSLTGGAMGLTLIVAELLRVRFALFRSSAAMGAQIGAALLIGAIVYSDPGAAIPLFFVPTLLVGGVVLAYLAPAQTQGGQIAGAGLFAIFLFNILIVRQSPTLGPAVSWHLYHILIAVWVVGVSWILLRRRVSSD
jgi:hypothetical protein